LFSFTIIADQLNGSIMIHWKAVSSRSSVALAVMQDRSVVICDCIWASLGAYLEVWLKMAQMNTA